MLTSMVMINSFSHCDILFPRNNFCPSIESSWMCYKRQRRNVRAISNINKHTHSLLMKNIKHKYVQVNGLNLHVAEMGSKWSPSIIFLHGFPGAWYTWRYQMTAVANAGFRAIALDCRGYGLSDSPVEPESASFDDFVNDIAPILDSLDVSKVFVVGRDFGSMVSYLFSLLHPERVAGPGIITFVLPYMPPGAVEHHLSLPEGFYVRRWQEPGRAEADFGRFDAKTVIRNIYILFSRSEIPMATESQEIMDLFKPCDPLPSWFTEENLANYGDLYEQSGFQTALQVPYRSVKKNDGFTGKYPNVEAPAMLIMGEEDYVMKYPGMDEYINTGEVKKYVPNLETVYVPHGTHFVNEQFPDHVNQLILTFLDQNKHRLVV